MDIEFCQTLFSALIQTIMWFILYFVNVIYHVDLFVYIEPSTYGIHDNGDGSYYAVDIHLICCLEFLYLCSSGYWPVTFL